MLCFIIINIIIILVNMVAIIIIHDNIFILPPGVK